MNITYINNQFQKFNGIPILSITPALTVAHHGKNRDLNMTTFDLNRLWLSVAGEESLEALRMANPETSMEELRVMSDFWSPTRRRVNQKARIAEVS